LFPYATLALCEVLEVRNFLANEQWSFAQLRSMLTFADFLFQLYISIFILYLDLILTLSEIPKGITGNKS